MHCRFTVCFNSTARPLDGLPLPPGINLYLVFGNFILVQSCLFLIAFHSTHFVLFYFTLFYLPSSIFFIKGSKVYFVKGGSNMTGTDLCVNNPHCAAAVRP